MITAENIFDNFKSTMSGLEKGLQVSHITTPTDQLCCCQDDEEIEAVLVRSDLKPYRIVISGTKIYGLVTRSDFLKLPVFLLGFALVTHIEALMLNMIRETGISEEAWLEWLEPKPRRRNEIESRFADLSRQRSDPDKLELTYFSDKHSILEHLIALEKYAPCLPDKSLIHKVAEIRKLRNAIAHIGSNADKNDNLQKFIDRLRDTHRWIDNIEQWQTAKVNNTP